MYNPYTLQRCNFLHIGVTFDIQSLVFPYYTHECSCILKCQRKYVYMSHNMVLGSAPPQELCSL